jgi:hypothetical protein
VIGGTGLWKDDVPTATYPYVIEFQCPVGTYHNGDPYTYSCVECDAGKLLAYDDQCVSPACYYDFSGQGNWALVRRSGLANWHPVEFEPFLYMLRSLLLVFIVLFYLAIFRFYFLHTTSLLIFLSFSF